MFYETVIITIAAIIITGIICNDWIKSREVTENVARRICTTMEYLIQTIERNNG